MHASPNLVVARLSGGLGNQLFQYAAACGVAAQSDASVALDLSHFATDGERRFALARLLPDVPLLSGCRFDARFETARLPPQSALARCGIVGDLCLPVQRENDYEYDPALHGLRGGAYLFGFWQSWRYFAPVAAPLRRALVGDATVDSGTVAVHVRRGDYLAPANRAVFGLCAPDYYAAALDLLRRRLSKPRFRVFSDDPAWCRAAFSAPDVEIASVAGGDAVDDLRAMAGCRHHVLANSSLGWWGAWLGAQDDSIVVAPMPWYNEAPRAGDLLPESWIRLERATGAAWPRVGATPPRVSVLVLAHDPARRAAALASVAAQRGVRAEPIIAEAPPGCDGAALNAALARAPCDWIAFLDDRDEWLPDKLAIQLEAAELTGADAVLCRTIPSARADGTLPALYPPPGPPDCPLHDLVHAGHFIAGISHTIVRRDRLHALGRFDDGWQVGARSALLARLQWREGTLRLWQRLVRSPIAFLGDGRSP